MGTTNVREPREREPRGSRPESRPRERRERPQRARAPEMSQAERDAFAEFGLHTFEREYGKLRRLSMAEDFSASAASYALLRAQMATVIRALNVMDKSFKESGGRNAYSYVAMHGLARELSNDLRAFGDQTELAERVRRDVLQGVLQTLATSVVSDLIALRRDLVGRLSPNVGRAVGEAITAVQESLPARFEEADARAAEILRNVLSSR